MKDTAAKYRSFFNIRSTELVPGRALTPREFQDFGILQKHYRPCLHCSRQKSNVFDYSKLSMFATTLYSFIKIKLSLYEKIYPVGHV
ncbi:MAG TPA: hypothetical protein PKL15_13380, partial [Saprospiraceae bacterium]|nr:hypothetical protein [Saprospiraceae bacterium]